MSSAATPQLLFSCHADTGFSSHRMRRTKGGVLVGHMDNFVGVHAVMNAYFSGRMNYPHVRIELTHGEETDMEGAREVLQTLSPGDMVVVVDVTGVPTKCDFTIEKCRSAAMRSFVRTTLKGMSFELFEDCPDPIANEDESDVYSEKLDAVFFLGVPCGDGDYNAGPVSCRESCVEAVTEAIIRLAGAFQEYARSAV